MSPAVPEAFIRFREQAQATLLQRLPGHIERLGWSAEQIAGHQREALRSLLRHAQAHAPFHARRLGGVEAADFELEDLPRLPVMTKSELMANFDEAVTDRRITLRLAEEAVAASHRAPSLLFDSYVCQTTGGSSGRRGVFVSDVEAQVEFACSMMRPMVSRMKAAGGSMQDGLRIAMVAAASPVHVTGLAPLLTEGTPVTFAPIPATRPLGEIVAALNAMRPPVLYGYTSMVAALAREQIAGRLRIHPVSVTVTSETLSSEQRAAIVAAFGPTLVNSFGSTEGLSGHSLPGEEAISFASDLCIVELVDEANRPVTEGAASAKILVTNLFNRVQPLIRYEIGDRFIRLPAAPSHGHLRAIVEGRSDEMLRFGTIEAHPLAIRSVLLKEESVRDYQVRQTRGGVDVLVAADDGVDTGRLEAGLRQALRDAGLCDPEVRVERVPSLERIARTGKLRRFIPLSAEAAQSLRGA